VYIAQPPLYRVKKGNSEKYIKDEKALLDYLLEQSLNNIEITNLKVGTTEAELKDFVLGIQKFDLLLKTMSNRFDPDFLYFMTSKSTDLKKLLSDEAAMNKMVADFKAWIVKNPLKGVLDVSHTIEKDAEHNSSTLKVSTSRYGHISTSQFSYGTASSSEWTELSSLWRKFEDRVKLPIQLAGDEKEPIQFSTYSELLAHVLETSKKGNYIQRYKGLGEMNPEQLWETTLNPENRMLLQVSVEDAIAADETFSVLMGEEVEPRRKFINDNALLARELDV
jgi:DNA gyrase subunit B